MQVDHSDHWVNTGHLSVLHFSVSFKGALQGLSFDFEVGSNPQIRLLDLSPPLHVKLQSDHSDQGPSSRKIDNNIKNNHKPYNSIVKKQMGACSTNASNADEALVCSPTPTPDTQLLPLIDGLVSYELYADEQGFANW